jgi:hypothetical protein
MSRDMPGERGSCPFRNFGKDKKLKIKGICPILIPKIKSILIPNTV